MTYDYVKNQTATTAPEKENSNEKNEEMALLFSEATPYIQKYHGKDHGHQNTAANAMINETLKKRGQ